MLMEHSFTVPVPVDQAWKVLLDLHAVAPCMPGATLTEADRDTFAGTVKVKLGPVMLTYRGTGRFVERDEAAHRVVVEASGKESRAAGTAAARVTSQLVPLGEETRVEVTTDLTITGRPAQFGRGMLADVGGKLIGQFADCLAQTLTGPATPEPAADAGGGASVTSLSSRAGSSTGAPEAGVLAEKPAVTTPQEIEAIDLLKVTGVGERLRRYAPYAAVVLAALVLLRLLTRRRRS